MHQPAGGSRDNPTAGRDRAHVALLPTGTFPILRAGTQSPRQPERKGSFEKLRRHLTLQVQNSRQELGSAEPTRAEGRDSGDTLDNVALT